MLKKAFVDVIVVAVFLILGLKFGAGLRVIYDRYFPEPDYVIGNYEEIYKRTKKPVVLFSTSVCQFCRSARDLLQRENVPYQDFVVDKSAEARRQFEALDGGGVPMLLVGDRRIVGFREDVIRDSIARIRR